MLLSDISVKHPVMAIVINLLLVAFGLIALNRLALREYPDIDPPVISIDTTYTGASAQTVENRITRILEDRISGVEGIRYIESSSEDGFSSINIEFNTDRDIDAAANDVRERISRVRDDLPREADPPEVFKVDSNNDVIMWLNLASSNMNALQLTDYADRYIADRLSVLKGVARVRIGGEKRYAMRIWLNRKAMAARNVTTTDIENALRAENVELPGGRVESKQRELTVRIGRGYLTPEDFARLVIRRDPNGYLVRLGDVARVEVGPENRRTELRGNGLDMVGLGIIKQSKANTLEVSREVRKAVKDIQAGLPKGTRIINSYDTSVFIEAAIYQVYKTLGIALILVILVIYLFLGNLRAVLIPAVTVPISLVGTFIILNAFGYSLNLLTLLALVLAIGLVVDDAIVVLENITRRVHEGEARLLASFRGARQVGFAVIATTVVLLAVFLPITLLQGSVGRLFTEFAFTLSSAVVFSSVVALTLTPVMCAGILKQRNGDSRITSALQKAIDKITVKYAGGLKFCLAHPKSIIVIFVLISIAAVALFKVIPDELAPQEDRGAFFVMVKGPEGASFGYMQNYMRQIEKTMMTIVNNGDATRALSIMPLGFGSRDSVNSGIGIVVMKHWHDRKISTQQAMAMVAPQIMSLPGVLAFPLMRQGLGSRGIQQQVQFVIGGNDYTTLAKWRDVVLAAARDNPNLLNVDSDYKETKPHLIVSINRNRAAELGVSIRDIGQTLETMMGSRKVTTYLDKGEEYEVMLEAQLKDKATPKDLRNIYVRSRKTQKLIPLSNLVTLKEEASPSSLNRFNRLRAITITANLAPGYTLGQALTFLENVVKEKLPKIAKIDYKGRSRDFKEASTAVYFTFALAILIMYLVLAAQFGSFVHPLVILITAPLAITGALFGLFVTHNTLNIYSQIGLVMLLGLAAKNAILMIEFINQLREHGVKFREAILQGCGVRLRPVLMTAFSTIFGAIPLILATGAGAHSRIAIGVVIFFGVTFATLLTLFFIPVFYDVLAKRTKPRNYTKQKLEQLVEDARRV
jgi:multidrug efflux pump